MLGQPPRWQDYGQGWHII